MICHASDRMVFLNLTNWRQWTWIPDINEKSFSEHSIILLFNYLFLILLGTSLYQKTIFRKISYFTLKLLRAPGENHAIVLPHLHLSPTESTWNVWPIVLPRKHTAYVKKGPDKIQPSGHTHHLVTYYLLKSLLIFISQLNYKFINGSICWWSWHPMIQKPTRGSIFKYHYIENQDMSWGYISYPNHKNT